MTDFQDSSSIPLSGPLQSKAQINRDRMQRWVEAIAGKVVSDRMAGTYQQIGSSNARLQQDLQGLTAQITALREEIKANRDELQGLHAAYDEYREWGDSVAKSVSEASADTRTLERSMERVDGLVEIAQLMLTVLEPVSRGINWLIDKLHGLSRKDYSQKDGADITGLVRPRRRASDRNR